MGEITQYQTYFFTPLLGLGIEASVYAISNSHVVRVPHLFQYKGQWEDDLERTLENHLALHNHGVSIPKAFGIQDASIVHWDSKFGFYRRIRKGLVMERIHGIKGSEVKQEFRQRMEELFEMEEEKVWDAGYCPDDTGRHNMMYVPDEDKLYLIDLSCWRKVDLKDEWAIRQIERMKSRKLQREERIRKQVVAIA